MALTVEISTEREITLAEYLEQVAREVDPRVPETALSTAESLRALCNNRRFLSEHINPFNHAMQMPDVARMVDMSTSAGRALADKLVAVQAQIIAFSNDYQLIMLFILGTIPLTLMIGKTKAALRAQTGPADHAVME